MTPRERVLTAVDRRMPDRTPADYKAEPDVNRYMKAAQPLPLYFLRRCE